MENKKDKILFVCYGNTCRSPMAEGIAKKYFKNYAEFESAGISINFNKAADNSIIALKELYNIDISNHIPDLIDKKNLKKYTKIIVLDDFVYNGLLKNYNEIENKLILLKINDPFGQDLEKYKETAKTIYKKLDNYFNKK